METALPDLDALAASYESTSSSTCTICAFITSQDDPEPWDALLNGHRRPVAVFQVLKQYGYTAESEDPVRNHRNKSHRK